MPPADDIWVPLVDEPIGGLVDRIHEEDPEIGPLVASPERLLAFKTFAYIRVGLILGELLMDTDVGADDETWVERLLADPANRARIEREVRAVAEEIAADPGYGGDEPVGPDDEARERFRAFARKQLESS